MKSTHALRSFLLGSSVLAAFPMLHAADRFWDGTSTTADADGGAGTWNAANTNWDTLATGGADTTFTSGTDSAVFIGAAGTITLGVARTAAGLSFNTGGTVISATSTNFLTIGAGGITVDASAGSGNQIGSAGLSNGYVTINATQEWTNSSAHIFFARDGEVSLGSNTLTLSGPGQILLASTTNGSGSIVVSSGATVSMSGNNGYSGTTTIHGTLTINSLTAFSSTSGLGDKASNLAGNLVIDGGTLRVQVSATDSDRLFSVGAGGATFEAVNTGANSGQIKFTGATAITYSGTGNRNITLGGASDDVNGSSIARAINDVGGGNGTVGLIKNGIHAWTVSGATNSYTGGTTVNQGTLSFGATGKMGATTGTLTVSNTNSTVAGTNTVLNLATGQDTTTGSLSGTIATPTSGTNTATINIASTRNLTVNQTSDGTYAGKISGAGNFSLGSLSTHNLTLTGTNDYGGGTTVTAGTLTLGSASALGSAAANITGGSLNLGGQTIANVVSIGASGTLTGSGGTGAATLAGNVTPGGSGSGLITMTSATVSSTSAIVLQLAATGTRGTDYDALTVSSALALDGTITVNLNGLTPAGGQLFDLIDCTGSIDVTNFTVATDLILPALGGGLVWDTSAFVATGVVSISSGGSTYADWLLANAPATGFDTDTDNDGIPNGVENVLGSSPNAYNAGLTEVSSTGTSVVYKHTLNPTIASDVTYGYEWSTDLVEWKTSGQTNTGGIIGTISPSAPVLGVVTVTITTDIPSTKLFGRLMAVK